MVQKGKALRLSGIENKWSAAALSSFSYTTGSWEASGETGATPAREGETSGRERIDYDKSGRITTWGRVLDGVASTWSFEYSRASELTGGTLKNASDQVTKTMRYLYDGSGNRVLKGEDTSSEYARYNSLNQLNKIGGKGLTLIEGTVDEPSTVTVNGQRTETVQVPGTSTYRFERQIDAKEGSNTVEIEATDARNNTRTDQWQFTVGPVQKMLEYDLNGNLLNDGIRAFTWDAKNRLKSVVTGGVTYAWEYDGLDRRIREKRDGTLVKEWIWDGLQMIQERDGSGAITKAFYDNGETVGGSNYYFTADHLGSVREMVDATGTVRARYDYDLYGKREKLSGDLEADFGFTGHYWHAETSLYLAPYRAYDPSLGRWLSRDPSGEFAGSNLYSYVLNNPINLWDPYGLDWLDSTSNFFAGFADSATFGLSSKAREGYLNALGIDDAGDGADHCSSAYNAGENTELALEIASTGGSGALKAAAKNASRKAVRNAARRATRNIARNGKQLHHNNPLFGHPGGGSTLFPTGGLPASVHSSGANLRLLDPVKHAATHANLQRLEKGAAAAVNPATTAARAARNATGSCP